MNTRVFGSLSTMMFLEFFVWGAWYVTVGIYMSELGLSEDIHWAYTVGPISAIISPFFLGLIADRFFATEKVLGVLHIVGGVFLLLAPMAVEGDAPNVGLFITLLLMHMLCYMPTIGLANTLAFHNMTDQEKEFPIIRVFGTVGWIVAGILVGVVLGAESTAIPLYVAGGAGVLMGLFCFSLPHTPPPAAGKEVSVRSIMGLDALSQLNSRSFTVFIVSSFLICIPLAAYYSYAPVFLNDAKVADPAFKMSFGQMSEVAFMLLMPFFFARLGVKWMLVVGMVAWVVRYALFAIAAPEGVVWMILAGVILHGICYDFFFVTGQIYVDKKSTPEIRGQAQGFLVLVTLGIGMLIGAQTTGWLFNETVTGEGATLLEQWQDFWWIPAIFAAVVIGVFTALFNDKVETTETVH